MLNHEHGILNKLCDTWGVDQTQILPTANRFFDSYKKLTKQTEKQDLKILQLQVKYLLKEDTPWFFSKSEQPNPTLYFSQLPQFAAQLQETKKGIIFVGSDFVIGLMGDASFGGVDALHELCKGMSSKEVKMRVSDSVKFDFKIKGKKPIVYKGVMQISITGAGFDVEKMSEFLHGHKFMEL